MSQVVPIFDAMLRLDHLAQTIVPYANSSFLRCSDQAFMESPFWNRLDPVFIGSSRLDRVAAERYRLIQLVGAHNKLTRIVWSCWAPANEWPVREELMGFRSEMMLWKATSPATFANPTVSDDVGNMNAFNTVPLLAYDDFDVLGSVAESEFMQTAPFSDFPPYFFASNEAALNAAMYNDYLGCAYTMISITDDDPIASELEAFNLVYENLRIAAGLIERHKNWENSGSPYKPCDAVSMGIITFLSHGAWRCFSSRWQKWTINALRQIGREGLSNGHTVANMVEILRILEANTHYGNADADDMYLGPIGKRLMPLLMPRGQDDQYLAFYLKHGLAQFNGDDSSIQIVAKASWRQESDGTMHSLKLEEYDPAVFGNDRQHERPRALELFDSWRQEVAKGWHGYLSNEI